MWDTQNKTLKEGYVEHFIIAQDEKALSYRDVLKLWHDSFDFRVYFNGLLADSPFSAFRWETPCVTTATLDRVFEFVLLRCDALDRTVDVTSFGSHFDTDLEVATFSNLGGDAVLVVPCPVADNSICGHLASFVRAAPESQLHTLWQSVAIAMNQRVSDRPVWLSTAGMGVSWLHVRLDDRPKYYGHRPFKQAR